MELWNTYNGEPWLDNPGVFLINKRKRKKGSKTMARRRGRKRSPARRRRVVRRRRSNPVRRAAPRRRRRRTLGRRAAPRRRRRVGVRRYRRNPSLIAGLDLKQLLTGGAAVIVAPMLEKQLLPLLPASLSGTTTGRWAVKLGSALGVWYAAKMALGRRASDVVAIALGSSIVADAVQEFAPSLTGGFGAYTRGGLRAYTPNNRLSGSFGNGRGLGLVMPGQMSRGMRGVLGPGSVNRTVGVRSNSDGIFTPGF